MSHSTKYGHRAGDQDGAGDLPGTLIEDQSNGDDQADTRPPGSSEAPPGQDAFAKLPDEVWLQIFGHVSQATLARTASVSKRWRRLAYDKTFWKNVSISFRLHSHCDDCVVKSGTLGHVLGRGCRSLKLELYAFELPVFSDDAEETYPLQDFDFMPRVFSSLSVADRAGDSRPKFSIKRKPGATENVVGLLAILKCCPWLQRIAVRNVKVDDELCRAIGGHNQRLREVRFERRMQDVSQCGLLAIAKGCRRLEVLRLGYFHRYAKQMSAEELRTLIAELPTTVESLDVFSGCTSFTDDHVMLLVETCPSLTAACFSNCPLLTSKAVQQVCRLSRLAELDVRFCDNIGFEALCGLSRCPSLRTLLAAGSGAGGQLHALQGLLPHCNVVHPPVAAGPAEPHEVVA